MVAVAFQRIEPVAWWNRALPQLRGRLQHQQLASGSPLNRGRKTLGPTAARKTRSVSAQAKLTSMVGP
jgi:hypothetical protein